MVNLFRMKSGATPVYRFLRERALAQCTGLDAGDDADRIALPEWLATAAPEAALRDTDTLLIRLGEQGPHGPHAIARARKVIAQRCRLRRGRRFRSLRRYSAASLVVLLLTVFTGLGAKRDAGRPEFESLAPPPRSAGYITAVKLPAPPPPVAGWEKSTALSGLASWYGPGFHGHQTADGTIYDQNEMTAAHRDLPLGSIVAVRRRTPAGDGAMVVLRITDRGPYVDKDHRKIDLSHRAAELLGVLERGVAAVEIEVLYRPDRNQLHHRRTRAQAG